MGEPQTAGDYGHGSQSTGNTALFSSIFQPKLDLSSSIIAGPKWRLRQLYVYVYIRFISTYGTIRLLVDLQYAVARKCIKLANYLLVFLVYVYNLLSFTVSSAAVSLIAFFLLANIDDSQKVFCWDPTDVLLSEWVSSFLTAHQHN